MKTEVASIKTVCAWCQDIINAGQASGNAERISHGICQPCYVKQMDDYKKQKGDDDEKTNRIL